MKSKSALVVGASRGLGLGLARALARGEWSVTATVRSAAGASALASLASSAGVDLAVRELDLANTSALDAFANSYGRGPLDLILVNAGQYGPEHQSTTQVTAAELSELIWVNALAPVRLATLLQDRVRSGSGAIAFMSSVRGSIGSISSADAALYKASKAALNSMARSLYSSLKQRGVSLRLFHPGWVRTDMGGPDAPLSVDESVAGVLALLEHAQGAGDEAFLDYRGDRILW